jgi:hypothetical protein
MKFREYLGNKGVGLDGLCWPSYSQSAGSFSDVEYELSDGVISLYVQEQYGRFGNNVHQILHALIVARKLSIKHIFCKFYLDKVKTKQIFIDDMAIEFGVDQAPEPPQISATMFYLQGFEKFISVIDHNKVKQDAEKLSRALKLNVPSELRSWNRKLVVFHFRSGDIFSTDINPIYAQPPLSYYTKVFDHICDTMEDFDVCVAYEDSRNPCIENFKKFLNERHVSYRTSSSSFEQDAKLIISANCIVSSYSSFCDMLALMNENLDRWYAFRSTAAFEIVDLSISREFANILLADGTEVYRISDDKNLYTPLGEWSISADKIDQLLNYPASNLSINMVHPPGKLSSIDR